MLTTSPFTPRPSQQDILRYTGGRLGIATVPSAGGAPDERWDNYMLHLLDLLMGNDSEAVDTSVLMVDEDFGQVK